MLHASVEPPATTCPGGELEHAGGTREGVSAKPALGRSSPRPARLAVSRSGSPQGGATAGRTLHDRAPSTPRRLLDDAQNAPTASPAPPPLAEASRRLRRPPGRPRKRPPRIPRSEARGDTRVAHVLEPRARRGVEPSSASVHVAGSPRLIPAREAARYLGVSYWTVLALRDSGTLRPVRLPLAARAVRRVLFDRAELDRLVDAGRS